VAHGGCGAKAHPLVACPSVQFITRSSAASHLPNQLPRVVTELLYVPIEDYFSKILWQKSSLLGAQAREILALNPLFLSFFLGW